MVGNATTPTAARITNIATGPMMGQIVQGRGQRAKPGGTGHAGDGADDAGRDADAEIDHGHGQQIAAEMLLDLVEDPQRAQPFAT